MIKTAAFRHTRALGMTVTLLSAGSAAAASIDAAPGFFFNTLPFNDTGTTVGAINDIGTIPATVSTFPTVAGPDVFYRFWVATEGSMTFQVSVLGATGYDPAIYLLRGTPESSSAIIGRDTGGANVTESFTTVVSPGQYYFVVDSFYASGGTGGPSRHQGAYTLTVSGTAELAAIPEPGSAAFLGAAAAATAWRRRRTGRKDGNTLP